jgi:hypothetical protein
MVKLFDETGLELPSNEQCSNGEAESNKKEKEAKGYDSWFSMGISLMDMFIDMFLGLLENVISQTTGINLAKNTFWQDFVKKGIHEGAEHFANSFTR